MPDPKTPVAEVPVDQTSEQDAAELEQLADEVETAETEPIAEDAETEEAAESSSSPEKTPEAKPKAETKATGEEDEVDDTEEFMQKDDGKKDNVQRRIDQLTAQLKELKSENAKLKDAPKETPKTPKYTDEQLKGALKKAVDEGDPELIWEVLQYKVKAAQQELIDQYEGAQKGNIEKLQAVHQEWNKVCNDYSKVWQDDSGKEIYPGAKNELSLGSNSTLLYRLAMKFFTETVDDEGRPVYRNTPGGQRLAVADAVNAILKKRRLGGVDSEKKRLERKLAKTKRQGAVPSSSSSDDSPARQKSTGDTLADYVAERKKFLNERRG